MSTTNFNIRKYKNEDWVYVLDIFNRAKPDEVKGSIDAKEIVPLNQDSGLMKSFQNSTIYVAVNTENNEIVGFVGINKYLISFLFSDPLYYRKGIGKMLIEHVLPNIGEMAWLLVAKTNVPAINLYKKYNFQIAEEYIGKYNNKVEIKVLRLAINPNLRSWESRLKPQNISPS